MSISMDCACSMRVSSFRDMQRFMIPLSSKRDLFEPKGVPVDTHFLHHSHDTDTPKRKAKSVSLWICPRVIYRSIYLAPGCLTCFSAQTTRCSWNCAWRWYTALSGTSGVVHGSVNLGERYVVWWPSIEVWSKNHINPIYCSWSCRCDATWGTRKQVPDTTNPQSVLFKHDFSIIMFETNNYHVFSKHAFF